MKTLNHLKIGEKAIVYKVQHSSESGRRLREMGIVPGTALELVAQAPLADPILVKVLESMLSIRRIDASFILLQPESLV